MSEAVATGSTSTPAVAGSSTLPERPVTTPAPEKKSDEKRKRRPKRKRVASEAGATEDGEVADAPAEAYSTPWVDKLGAAAYESKEQRLHDEIVAFFEYMAPTPEERHARAVVIAQVADVVRWRLNKAAVDTFGSVAQDLYLPDGDTDLVITTRHTYDDEAKRRVLYQLAAFMRNSHVTDRVQVIARARVPVISFQTRPELGSLKMDISLNAADGLRAVPVLRGYFERMPALRYLVLALKSLLSRHALNAASSSGLSSYGLILLVASFLQLNPAGRAPEQIERPLEHGSLGVLLMDFLEYYADGFPYETGYVSVTQGKVLPKEEKGWVNEAHPDSLCIECLLNTENDVGRPTSKIKTIRALFREAHSVLQSYPFSPDAPPYNILGTILGVSESTLAHRNLIKDVVNSGKLMQALQDVKHSVPPPGGNPRRPPPSSAQQPYPPRQYVRPNAAAQAHGGKGAPRALLLPTAPSTAGAGPPPALPAIGLPAKPTLHHSLPPRPDTRQAPQGPRGGRAGGGRAPEGRLLDRLEGSQRAGRRRT